MPLIDSIISENPIPVILLKATNSIAMIKTYMIAKEIISLLLRQTYFLLTGTICVMNESKLLAISFKYIKGEIMSSLRFRKTIMRKFFLEKLVCRMLNSTRIESIPANTYTPKEKKKGKRYLDLSAWNINILIANIIIVQNPMYDINPIV